MSSEFAIHAQGIGKCFEIYKKPADRIKQIFAGREKRLYEEFWALKDVSFDINRGEVVGIIGRNGSGKSTLLEIIAGTLTASTGDLRVNGRVSALLELGAGFNPEFTGRENVYLNGSILGLNRRQVDQRMDTILEFAGIGEYVDRAVKTYSSGMFVRLAFAVAISLDPDILIVDEALAVGDIRFQRRCYRRFDELKAQGKTILFVTHSTELVRTHCDRVLFLDGGKIRQFGSPRETVHEYLNMMFAVDHVTTLSRDGAERERALLKQDSSGLSIDPAVDACVLRRGYNPTEFRWGDGRARIFDYLVSSATETDPVTCETGAALWVRMRVSFAEEFDNLIYGLTVKTVDGTTVYGANTRARNVAVRSRLAGEIATVEFRLQANILPGEYFFSLGVAVDDDQLDNAPLDRRFDLFHIHVEGEMGDFGIADLQLAISEPHESAENLNAMSDRNRSLDGVEQ